jgi:hypothetical protein
MGRCRGDETPSDPFRHNIPTISNRCVAAARQSAHYSSPPPAYNQTHAKNAPAPIVIRPPVARSEMRGLTSTATQPPRSRRTSVGANSECRRKPNPTNHRMFQPEMPRSRTLSHVICGMWRHDPMEFSEPAWHEKPQPPDHFVSIVRSDP